MACDEALTDRVREVISLRDGAGERKMFGGIGFMIAGNMACGVHRDGLVVRLGTEEAEHALAEEHVRAWDHHTGRPVWGWLLIDPAALESDEDLAGWVAAGADFAAALPPK
jgi:TfoX/Sxy family transcriptional regulator of competence genes